MEIKVNDYAILGIDLSLSLGQSWKPETIFQNLSIKVLKGAIYGLIGPSGCGKTTLQRCIFGFYRPTKGKLLVFGRSPLEKGFGVPGPLVGFMPQDLALNEDLTVKEILTFFGRLNNLSIDTVNQRIDELLKVIDIPYPDRLLNNLSIGQRRRISLAAALIHRPKLLLLDEPTVGSDPAVVFKMWTYLFHLRDNFKMTIVVTTHYLEEIVKADRFGMMRNGNIIAEDNPKAFMESYRESSMERAVFKLCTEWDKQKRLQSKRDETLKRQETVPETSSRVTIQGDKNLSLSTDQHSPSTHSYISSNNLNSLSPLSLTSTTETWQPLSNCTVFAILMWRLSLRCRRFIIYPIILSCFLIFIIDGTFSAMFGRFPKDLKLDYILPETGNQNISEQFLSILSEKKFTLQRVDSELQGRMDVEHGRAAGYFVIGEDFGDNIRERMEKGLASVSGPSPGYLSKISTSDKILLTFDASDAFKTDAIIIKMYRSLENLIDEVKRSINMTTNNYQFVTFTPIYESYEPEEFMASNEITLIRYFFYGVEQFTIIIMMTWTLQEAQEKMNERLMASGIHRIQLIFSLMLTSLIVIVPTYQLLFAVLVPILGIPMRGSWIAVLLSIFGIVTCGIAKGVLIGLASKNLIAAAFIHSGYCFSSLSIGYLIWPYESLPHFMKPLVYWIPFALTSDSMVWTLIKGKALTDPLIYLNIIYTIGFGFASAVLVAIGFHSW